MQGLATDLTADWFEKMSEGFSSHDVTTISTQNLKGKAWVLQRRERERKKKTPVGGKCWCLWHNFFEGGTILCQTQAYSNYSDTHREANMQSNLRYTYPPVFTVDAVGGFQHQAAGMEPPLVPCWTLPPARVQAKRRGCGGMSSARYFLIMVLLTVFATLGLGAYQLWRLQTELLHLKQVRLICLFVCHPTCLFPILFAYK